jgi:phage baseplate assembly protein W
MAIGFTLPFSKSSGSVGYFDTTSEDVSAAKENLKSLLLTNWGERVCHYYFGCNFKEFLFENIRTDELKTKMADRILNQVENWLPFIVIQKLNILLNTDDPSIPENGMRIAMSFGLISKPDLSSKLEIIVSQ